MLLNWKTLSLKNANIMLKQRKNVSQTLEQVQCDVSRSDGYDARMCGFDSTR